jgi:hypothetical protein
MRRIFTEFVCAFDDEIGEPDERLFEELWQALRSVLVNELKRRGLWTSPPSYLGIHEWSSWKAGQHDEKARHDGALDELVTECYLFVFVTRIGNLQRQLAVKDNIDGLVLLSIRNFLFERQKRYDPLGYRVFGLLRAAIRKAIDEGDLFVLEGDSTVRNDTILGFHPGVTAYPSPSIDWAAIARHWVDLLIPQIVTAWGRGQSKVVDDLHHLLKQLCDQDITVFGFKDLVDPLKRDVRTRWATVVGHEFGTYAQESSGALLLTSAHRQEPGSDLIEKQSFMSLVAGFRRTLNGSEFSLETKQQLSTLFELLTNYAIAEIAGGDSPEISLGEPGNSTISRPSNRKIAAALGISRSRLERLLLQLGEIINTVRSRQSAQGAVISLSESEGSRVRRGKEM